MKHKGSVSLVQIIRDREIVQLFFKLKRTCLYRDIPSICRVICDSPASRHYISEERARIVLMKHIKGKKTPTVTHAKERMYASFIKAYFSVAGTDSMRIVREAVIKAIDMPSNSFGISASRIRYILRKEGMK